MATKDDLHETLLRQLECPVCFETCLPPIMMCDASHILCSRCREKISACPRCRQPMGTKRNYFAEETCSSLKIPCKNATNGCDQVFNLTQLEAHLPDCSFKNYDCNICLLVIKSNATCWTGPEFKLRSHVEKDHPDKLYTDSITLEYSKVSTLVQLRNRRTYCQLLYAEGGLFWFKQIFDPGSRELEFVVLHVGRALEAAATFSYKLRMGHEDGSVMTFSSQARPEGLAEAEGNTCKLNQYFLKLLARNDVFHFSMRVYKKPAD